MTDGTSFWVVDGTKLKVFKYTLTGSLLGSWSIDPANTHPTGITINPNNVSDIWIVDNGTDKVYQYIGAASRTSGSQNAGATFALAPGNTNPQGIADPPTADLLLTQAAPPSAALDVPSLTSPEAVFDLLARQSLQTPSESAVALLSGQPLMPALNDLIAVVGGAWTTAGTFEAPNPLESLTFLPPGSSRNVQSDGSAMGFRSGTLAGENSEAAAAATDLFSAGSATESAS